MTRVEGTETSDITYIKYKVSHKVSTFYTLRWKNKKKQLFSGQLLVFIMEHSVYKPIIYFLKFPGKDFIYKSV